MEYKRIASCYSCPVANWDNVEPIGCDIIDGYNESKVEGNKMQESAQRTIRGIKCCLLEIAGEQIA